MGDIWPLGDGWKTANETCAVETSHSRPPQTKHSSNKFSQLRSFGSVNMEWSTSQINPKTSKRCISSANVRPFDLGTRQTAGKATSIHYLSMKLNLVPSTTANENCWRTASDHASTHRHFQRHDLLETSNSCEFYLSSSTCGLALGWVQSIKSDLYTVRLPLWITQYKNDVPRCVLRKVIALNSAGGWVTCIGLLQTPTDPACVYYAMGVDISSENSDFSICWK